MFAELGNDTGAKAFLRMLLAQETHEGLVWPLRIVVEELNLVEERARHGGERRRKLFWNQSYVSITLGSVPMDNLLLASSVSGCAPGQPPGPFTLFCRRFGRGPRSSTSTSIAEPTSELRRRR